MHHYTLSYTDTADLVSTTVKALRHELYVRQPIVAFYSCFQLNPWPSPLPEQVINLMQNTLCHAENTTDVKVKYSDKGEGHTIPTLIWYGASSGMKI